MSWTGRFFPFAVRKVAGAYLSPTDARFGVGSRYVVFRDGALWLILLCSDTEPDATLPSNSRESLTMVSY